MWSFGAGALGGNAAVFVANSNAQTLRPFLQPRRWIAGFEENRVPWRDGGPPGHVAIRWMRTNSLWDATSATSNPFCSIGWFGSDGVSASKVIFDGSVNSAHRIYPNQFAPNSWHSAVFSASPAPGTIQVSMPTLSVYATSGTIAFDAFDARQI